MSAPGGGSRFTTQNQTTDQRLSNNVVGLVELSDFRKRRAEVLEQQEREAREAAAGGGAANGDSGGLKAVVDAETPDRSQTGTPVPGSAAEARAGGEGGGESAAATEATGEPAKKKKKTSKEGMEGRDGGKKKKGGKASKLSFLGDEDEEEEAEGEDNGADATPRGTRKGLRDDKPRGTPKTPKDDDGPADGVPPPIKSFTQQAQRRQAAEREALRREFLALQAAVKAAEVAIPFVFYEGANIPGGVVRVRKGDFVWQFLDRSRKVGARLGVGEKRLSKARLHWARINVDDLMLVRGNLIIPHHYDFYFFLINKTVGPGGTRVFEYSSEPPDKAATTGAAAPAAIPAGDDDEDHSSSSNLEGAGDDPGLTKVVDRRWYERNKHIYPASLWQEFDPEIDYTTQVRRDQGGNAYFAK